jgi:hypothetical protein
MTAALQEIYKRHGPCLSPEEEATLFSISVHESAHGLVAAHFGLKSKELVLATNGVCVHDAGSALANAAVSWAGFMGEALMNAPREGRALPTTKLTSLTLSKWIDEVRLNELSNSDRRGIEGYPRRLESARAAYEILSENLEALEYLSNSLASRSREKFAQSTRQSVTANEQEIARFARDQWEIHAAKLAEKNTRRALARAEELLASLPPVRVPAEFNLETFRTATGASEEEIAAFTAYKVLRERNGVGLGGAPTAACEVALKFFCEHGVENRDRWIYAAREFCTWRKQRT